MRNRAFLLLAGLCPASLSVRGAVLNTRRSPPNSTKTTVYGINNNNVIAGSFIGKDDRVEHAFLGSLGAIARYSTQGVVGLRPVVSMGNDYIRDLHNERSPQSVVYDPTPC
jgi:hypothetical protein